MDVLLALDAYIQHVFLKKERKHAKRFRGRYTFKFLGAYTV